MNHYLVYNFGFVPIVHLAICSTSNSMPLLSEVHHAPFVLYPGTVFLPVVMQTVSLALNMTV
jgi:hypothetical protein